MSIVSCTIRDKTDAQEDEKTLSVTEEFLIQVTSGTTILDVLQSEDESVPKPGDPHPDNTLDLIVRSRNIRFTEPLNRLYFIMDVEYDDNSNLDLPTNVNSNNIQVLKVTLDSWSETIVLENTVDGQDLPIEDTANSKIKYETEAYYPRITITSQTQDPALNNFIKLTGTVNSGKIVNWLGMSFERDQLLFENYKATSVGNNTWQEDFIFKAKFVRDFSYGAGAERIKGWQPQLLMAGFWQIVDGERVMIFAPNQEGAGQATQSEPVSEPWPLDDNGAALKPEDIENRRVFKEFVTYKREDFSVFRFDFESLITREKEKQLANA